MSIIVFEIRPQGVVALVVFETMDPEQRNAALVDGRVHMRTCYALLDTEFQLASAGRKQWRVNSVLPKHAQAIGHHWGFMCIG